VYDFSMNSARRSFMLAVSALLASTAARAWFGPSAEKPYALVPSTLGSAAALVPTWTWVDARVGVEADNRPTRDGYWFGDAVFALRPYAYIQEEFLRQVALHEERDALVEKLTGKTIRLLEFDAAVGLWVRLNEKQSGRWESVRIRASIEFDGTRYQASDTHPFNNSEKPSPASVPMREVVQSLVNQIFLF
jgi:hypothetical protein